MNSVVNKNSGAILVTQLETANTGWQRMRGLLGRSRHDFVNGQGLWLHGCDGIHTIGMTFPIDVAYLDINNRIVHLYRNLRPYRIGRIKWNTKSVLELPAGMLTESDTKVGDYLQFLENDNS